MLSDVKTPTTNGITAPAIKPCTIGAGIQSATRTREPEDRHQQEDRARHDRGASQLGEGEPVSQGDEEDDREDVPGEQQRLPVADREDEGEGRRPAVEDGDPSARLGVGQVETGRSGGRQDDPEHGEVDDRDRDRGVERGE